MINEQSSFYFRSQTQKTEWEKYLKEKQETHQEGLMNIIDKAIQELKDITEWAERNKVER